MGSGISYTERQTPCSLSLLWMSAVPQHPCSHCCVHRLMFMSDCLPILRRWKSPLADWSFVSCGHIPISITLGWLHGRFILALMVPEVVAFIVPTLAVSSSDVHSSRDILVWLPSWDTLKDKSLLPQLPAECPAIQLRVKWATQLLYIWSSVSA